MDDEATTAEKIDAILDWAEEHPEFDTDFVESLASQLEDKGELSENQEDALDNIIEKWHIPV